MILKKGWIFVTALLVLCSVGCTEPTGETHRLYVQTADSESQIAETLPTAEQGEWITADSDHSSTKTTKSKKKTKTTKTTAKKKKSSRKQTTTKQKKETTAKVTTEKAAKTTKTKTTKAPRTTTAPRIAAESPFRMTAVKNNTEKPSPVHTTRTTSKAESPAPAKTTTLKTNVVIRTQPPVPVTIAPIETTLPTPPEQTDKYLSLSDGEMQGAGIVVSENQIFLQTAGIYHLSGNWNGNICVQAGVADAVELRLEGVSLHGTIQIQQAGTVTITAADRTENTILTEQAGAGIDSQAALQLQGTGSLQIQNASGNGIVCADAITITEGMLAVSAKDTAILSDKESVMLDGTVFANGGQAGIRCAETGTFTVEGGTLLATGNGTVIASDLQPMMQLNRKTIVASGHTVSFSINGIEAAKTVLQYDAETFFFTCPDLMVGNDVIFSVDGTNPEILKQQMQDTRWDQ